LESLLLAPYISNIKTLGVKVIVRTHNVEHELWQEKAQQAKGLKKIAYNMLKRKLFNNEVRALNLCDGIIAISPNEMNFVANYAVKTPAVWIPLAIEIDKKSSFNPSAHFFHIGAMDWQPNIEGLNWFFKTVWKHVHSETNALMHIAGKGLSKNDYSDIVGVVNHGEVSSASDFMRNSGILVVPIFSGSGIRIKIIEAGKSGIPLIATPKAVEGLQLEANVDYLVANTPAQFIEQMINLAQNKELQVKLGEKLKSKISNQFERTQLNNKLGEFIKSI
jgi:glycosyltransferase involved in cell wall biosynthesis